MLALFLIYWLIAIYVAVWLFIRAQKRETHKFLPAVMAATIIGLIWPFPVLWGLFSRE